MREKNNIFKEKELFINTNISLFQEIFGDFLLLG